MLEVYSTCVSQATPQGDMNMNVSMNVPPTPALQFHDRQATHAGPLFGLKQVGLVLHDRYVKGPPRDEDRDEIPPSGSGKPR